MYFFFVSSWGDKKSSIRRSAGRDLSISRIYMQHILIYVNLWQSEAYSIHTKIHEHSIKFLWFIWVYLQTFICQSDSISENFGILPFQKVKHRICERRGESEIARTVAMDHRNDVVQPSESGSLVGWFWERNWAVKNGGNLVVFFFFGEKNDPLPMGSIKSPRKWESCLEKPSARLDSAWLSHGSDNSIMSTCPIDKWNNLPTHHGQLRGVTQSLTILYLHASS